jgi:hypothetical protein
VRESDRKRYYRLDDRLYFRNHYFVMKPRIAALGSEPEIYFYPRRHSGTGYIYTYGLMEPQRYARRMQDEMIAEIEHTQPEYVVYVHSPTTWGREKGSRRPHIYVGGAVSGHPVRTSGRRELAKLPNLPAKTSNRRVAVCNNFLRELRASTAAVEGIACDHGQFLILREELCEARVAQKIVQIVEVAVAKSFLLVSDFQDD